MVFAREVNGQELTFGVSGKLIMNAVVIYDHQTETLWSQFLSEAVQGPMKGTKLELLPAQLTTWSAWSLQHPGTLALKKNAGIEDGAFYGFSEPNSFDPYTSYYQNANAGTLGETNVDPRLPTKSLVLGIVAGGTQRAYPFSALRSTPVINDSYNGQSIVVTFDRTAGTTAIFNRSVGSRALTFELTEDTGGLAAGEGEGEVLLRDQETGSIWGGASGTALSGTMAGSQLEQLSSFVAFWFSWSDFYPDTEVYSVE